MILRDGLVFFILTLITLVLYGLTLLLFRSFEQHREDLAVYWAQRGRDELAHGQPQQGTVSLRNALSYAPDNREYELLLAQALSSSGQTDQAINYFLNLWESQPGDGFINLELAHLARAKKRPQQAINYYHAALYGDWRADGPVRRRAIRLELADYLTSLHQPAAARAELLIASGNAPNNVNINLTLGTKFEAIGDLSDALNSYKKAVVDNPKEPLALESAGRLSFQAGDFSSAAAFYNDELKLDIKDEAHRVQVQNMASEAQHLTELSFSRELPARDRAQHLLSARSIASARFSACSAQLGDAALQQSTPMQDLKTRWKAANAIGRNVLLQNADQQDTLATLIGDTETITAQACGQPTGDNALLLKLTTSNDASR